MKSLGWKATEMPIVSLCLLADETAVIPERRAINRGP